MTQENPDLDKEVNPNESELKQLVVNYIGNRLNPENDEITVDMAITVLTDEFPELILALAEENFLRGYEQAFIDLELKKFPRD
jgi:hypothetical protein